MEGASSADTEVVVAAEEFRPEGYDITVECQVVRSTGGGVTDTMPMCAWGDGNTAAMVAVIRPADVGKDPASLDLAAIAEETARIRVETRRPIG